MNRNEAETIALRALAFIVAEPDRLSRFMALTGLTPDAIRPRDDDAEMLAGILDFLLQDEALVIEFSAVEGLDGPDVLSARRALPGWTGW